MRNRLILITIFTVLWIASNQVSAQVNQLDVQGHSKIRGNLNIAHMEDSTSMYIGRNSGFSMDHSQYNYNTYLGLNSGYGDTDGIYNSFFGASSGINNSIGQSNCFFGWESGVTNTTGSANAYFGNRTGAGNFSGSYNALFGSYAGYNGGGGNFNASFGAESGESNYGSFNSFFGAKAGRYNELGTRNTYLGYNAKSVGSTDSLDRAIAIGHNSKVDCHNCAVIGGIGEDAVKLGIGVDSPSTVLSLLEPGASNPVGITQNQVGGTSTMEFTTTDADHDQATRLMLRGDSDNPDISFFRGARGAEVLSLFIKGTNGNLGIGTNSPSAPLTVMKTGQLISDFVTQSNSQPVFHRFFYNGNIQGASLGFDTANDLVKFVHGGGFESSTNGIAINSTGQVGVNTEMPAAQLDVNGTLRVQNPTSDPGVPVYISPLGIISTAASDIRLKSQVETLSNGLEKIMTLRGVTYYWQDSEYPNREIGLIAQEVEEVLPEVVFTNSNTGYKGVKYAEIVAVLIEAVKEQQSIIDQQADEIKDLLQEVQRIDALEEAVNSLRSKKQ